MRTFHIDSEVCLIILRKEWVTCKILIADMSSLASYYKTQKQPVIADGEIVRHISLSLSLDLSLINFKAHKITGLDGHTWISNVALSLCRWLECWLQFVYGRVVSYNPYEPLSAQDTSCSSLTPLNGCKTMTRQESAFILRILFVYFHNCPVYRMCSSGRATHL